MPYVYPVDLRYLLSPPVSATECTNPVGIATYLAEINADTDIVDLARDINDTFKKDIADGVIQQSFLHFSPQYVGNPPGLPDVVMLTDNGIVPPMPTPPDLDAGRQPRGSSTSPSAPASRSTPARSSPVISRSSTTHTAPNPKSASPQSIPAARSRRASGVSWLARLELVGLDLDCRTPHRGGCVAA